MTAPSPDAPGQREADAGGEVEYREAVLGEVIHGDPDSLDSGWFILGVDGYFDVDNAMWCEPQDDDAPWDSEHFDLYGSLPDIIAAAHDASVVAAARAETDEWKETAQKFCDDYHAEVHLRIDAETALAAARADAEGRLGEVLRDAAARDQRRYEALAETLHQAVLRAERAEVLAGKLLTIHGDVVMDTPEDRALHHQVIATFRAVLDAAGPREGGKAP